MDSIGGLNVVLFTRAQVLSEIKKRWGQTRNKKVRELLAGYLISAVLEKQRDTGYRIGFPLKKVSKALHGQPTLPLGELIDNPNLLDDTDTDVIIVGSKRENGLFRCQVTRLVARNTQKSEWADLKQLLDKKSRFQSDPRLMLVINIEDNIRIQQEQSEDYFKEREYPFGKVVLIGKRSTQPGHFKVFELYPTLLDPYEFDIDFGL